MHPQYVSDMYLANLQEILDEFVGLTGIAAINYWKPNVTHVIAATDERGACSRTLKVLMAILGGKWVVSVNCECFMI